MKVIASTRISELTDLHWPTVAARIEFQIFVLAYASYNSTAPAYISDMLQPVSSLQRQTNLRYATNGTVCTAYSSSSC